MSSNYAKELGFKIRKTNVEAQKIDNSTLKILKMVIADFQVENKVGRPKFFQKTFLMVNIKFKVILRIFFLKISNTNMLFNKKILI